MGLLFWGKIHKRYVPKYMQALSLGFKVTDAYPVCFKLLGSDPCQSVFNSFDSGIQIGIGSILLWPAHGRLPAKQNIIFSGSTS